MHKYVVLLLVVTMTACASSRGFDRGNLRSQIVDQKVVTEEDIKKALELKPQLPAPFKLAVFFAPPKSGWRYGSSWNWMGEDKDTFIQMKSDLIAKNIISDMFVLSDSILEGTDNKAIRLAAAESIPFLVEIQERPLDGCFRQPQPPFCPVPMPAEPRVAMQL